MDQQPNEDASTTDGPTSAGDVTVPGASPDQPGSLWNPGLERGSGEQPHPTSTAPTSGVLPRIPIRDVPFIVMAGALLVIPFAIIVGGASSGLGQPDQAGEQSFFVSVGLGGAVALLLCRRLRANAIPLPLGCGAVVAWTILMMLAAVVGWGGTAVVAAAGLGIGMWITRPRRRHPA